MEEYVPNRNNIWIASIAGVVLLLLLVVLYFVPLRLSVLVTTERLYQYEDLKKEDLLVQKQSILGRTYPVKDFTFSEGNLNEASNEVLIESGILRKKIVLQAVLVTEICASYAQDQVYEGRPFQPELVTFTFVYEDGTQKQRTDFQIEGNPQYILKDSYKVEVFEDGICLSDELKLSVIKIKSITPVARYDWFTGDEICPAFYEIYFTDGSMEQQDAESIKVISKDPLIATGKNQFEIVYRGLTFGIEVFGVEKNAVDVVTSVAAEIYMDTLIPEGLLAFEVFFEDETSTQINDLDERIVIEDRERVLEYGDNEFLASYRDFPFSFTVHAIEKEISEVEPVMESAYVNEALSADSILVHYTDGTIAEKTDFVISKEQKLVLGANTCTIFYHDNYYSYELEATYRPIKRAWILNQEELLSKDTLSFDEVYVEFDNGKEEIVPISEIEVLSSLVMQEGVNTIQIALLDQEAAIEVVAHPRTAARLAKRAYADELSGAVYTHGSDNLFAVIHKETVGEGIYYLTHVVISHPSFIHGGMSNDTFGGARELSTSASARLNWVLGTNGSYFDTSTGYPTLAGVYIKSGSIVSGSVTNGKEMCLKSDGTLFTPAAGLSASALVEQGVIESFGTALPPLIENGVSQVKNSSDADKVADKGMTQSYSVSYPRTVYGMARQCDYYIITAGEGSYDNGISLAQATDILLTKGCVYARALDGGGSATLVFENHLVNVPAVNKKERAVADFIYFTE